MPNSATASSISLVGSLCSFNPRSPSFSTSRGNIAGTPGLTLRIVFGEPDQFARIAPAVDSHFLHVPQGDSDVTAGGPGRGHLLTQPGVAMRIDHQCPRLRAQSIRLRTRFWFMI